MDKKIVLYAAELCGDCRNLKMYMDANNIDYEERDIRKNPEYSKELEEKTGKQGVPYLVIDGEWVRGYQPGQPFSPEFAQSLFEG